MKLGRRLWLVFLPFVSGSSRQRGGHWHSLSAAHRQTARQHQHRTAPHPRREEARRNQNLSKRKKAWRCFFLSLPRETSHCKPTHPETFQQTWSKCFKIWSRQSNIPSGRLAGARVDRHHPGVNKDCKMPGCHKKNGYESGLRRKPKQQRTTTDRTAPKPFSHPFAKCPPAFS